MGASQSAPTTQEHVVSPEPSTSVQFSPSLISRLSNPPSDTSSNNPEDVVRRRLAAESAHIRQQEAEILQSINAALEKENLDREKPGMSSEVLGRDIEEVREKVERMKKEKAAREGEGVRSARESVRRCYLENIDHPLDCQRQVDAFKEEVRKLELAFVKSLQ
ncbi:hypothetical protein TREMEDRAFT_70657 [Tremella mesenterica DSM 1558]|uniref:uncharacterized protein n=1 Tax=Tremella mesenterica (strain ATCC 24925 / CBS 8224 / DSM 1558 / NBRC 9311 / NRRL Y-6157 / RJB 2259-6 / UBC 559-6) TaxID=578456 RepID=UPI0003F4A0EE|nr:uncharacterized protein TREMEDRAFT_70657 [Tremella mesenterica DSM 1558]EIW72243.1 hypothetical protein TREMEDRAFT_70657 [Tremella mesenterica DSM 1558]